MTKSGDYRVTFNSFAHFTRVFGHDVAVKIHATTLHIYHDVIFTGYIFIVNFVRHVGVCFALNGVVLYKDRA